MKQHQVDQATLELEAATAVGMLRDSNDLDKRIGVLRDRVSVSDDKLAAFIVTVPDDYSARDRATLLKYIEVAIERAQHDAQGQVEYDRMWNPES